MSTEHPIIFSAAMIDALLAGRKTQTRRLIKPQPPAHQKEVQYPAVEVASSSPLVRKDRYDACRFWHYAGDGTSSSPLIKSRYGAPGDQLWVRETWCLSDPEFEHQLPPTPRPSKDGRWVYYRATEPDIEGRDNKSPWRTPIYMPRWASRITLEITSLRVERLQSITEEDAQAEGLDHDEKWWYGPMHPVKQMPKVFYDARKAYRSCWNSLHPGAHEDWHADPFVWVISFRKLD